MSSASIRTAIVASNAVGTLLYASLVDVSRTQSHLSYERSRLSVRNEEIVCQALGEAGRPLSWEELRKITRLTRGTFGRALVRCVEKGWIKIGGAARDHRLVQLFELNLQRVSVNRIGNSVLVTRPETPAPVVGGRLKRLEVRFTPHGPAVARQHISRPVAHHPDNVEVWESPTVGMPDTIKRNTTSAQPGDWKRVENWRSPKPPPAVAQHPASDKAKAQDSAKQIGIPPCSYCKVGKNQPCLQSCNCALCREQLLQVCS